MKITSFKILKMLPLIEKGEKSVPYVQKLFYIRKNKFNSNIKIYRKVRDHHHNTSIYRGATNRICNLRYKNPNETPVDLTPLI